ncbi:MFS transporter [Shewanella sp.]|uniref:MFS transporter n=1 Tax=Shewanella sp. TaxID=50422 RepID=UPI003A96BB15
MFSQHTLFSRFGIVIQSISLFLVFATANATVPLYPEWQHKIGFSHVGISVIFIAYHIGVIFALLTFRKATQPQTIKKLLLVGLGSAMLAAIGFASANIIEWLVISRMFVGIASGIFASLGVAQILRIGNYLNVSYTPLLVTVATVLGFGVGPLYSGITADLSTHHLLIIFGLFFGAMLICSLLIVTASSDGVAASSATQPPAPVNLAKALMVTGMFAGPFALSGLFLSLGPSMISRLMDNDSRALAGTIPFLLFGFGVCVQFVLKKLSYRRMVIYSQLLSYAGAIVIIAAESLHSLVLMMLSALLIGSGQSLSQLAGLTMIKLWRPLGTLEKSSGFLFFGGYAVAACSIMMLGEVSAHFGLMSATIVFLLICLSIMTIAFARFIQDTARNSACSL